MAATISGASDRRVIRASGPATIVWSSLEESETLSGQESHSDAATVCLCVL